MLVESAAMTIDGPPDMVKRQLQEFSGDITSQEILELSFKVLGKAIPGLDVFETIREHFANKAALQRLAHGMDQLLRRLPAILAHPCAAAH